MVRRNRRGQSATELALMTPLIFGMLFAVIEYSYYFGAIHYSNYVTFVGARALQAGEESPAAAQQQLMTGNVTSQGGSKGITLGGESKGDSSASVTLNWDAETPMFSGIMEAGGSKNMDVDMEVVLGRNESYYELKSDPSKSIHSDNCMADGSCI